MFSSALLIVLGSLLYTFFFFPLHWVWTQNAISDTIVYTVKSPIHFYVVFCLYPDNALPVSTTDFAWVQAEPVLKSLLLKTESHNLKLCTFPTSVHTALICSVDDAVYALTVISLLRIYRLHSLLFFLSFLCYYWWFLLPHTATGLSWTGNGFLNAALLILAWRVPGVSFL